MGREGEELLREKQLGQVMAAWPVDTFPQGTYTIILIHFSFLTFLFPKKDLGLFEYLWFIKMHPLSPPSFVNEYASLFVYVL